MCRCGKETVRVSSTLLFTLSYPESNGMKFNYQNQDQRKCREKLALVELIRSLLEYLAYLGNPNRVYNKSESTCHGIVQHAELKN